MRSGVLTSVKDAGSHFNRSIIESATKLTTNQVIHLSIALLGQFQVTLAGQPVNTFANDKARSLLAYLAVESERAHSRSSLAALLWPEYSDASARTNLRQALHQLRDAIGDTLAVPGAAVTPFLLTSRQAIQFNRAAPFHLDVATFQTLLQVGTEHQHRPDTHGDQGGALANCLACRQRLQQAAELYTGDFLHGFAVTDSPPFEEWRRITQERLHLQMVSLLSQLANAYEALGNPELTRHYATRQLSLEPWREEAHLQLMRALALSGQRTAALVQYQTCRQVLATELGIEPNAATTQLYEQIRTGDFAGNLRVAQPPSDAGQNVADSLPLSSASALAEPLVAAPVAAPVAVLPNHNLPAQLTPFVGRARELAELAARLHQPDLRLLTLIGPGGMGKTRLALETARAQMDRHADGCFFIPLGPLTSAAALIPAIATAIGVDLHGPDLQKTLLHFLRPKQMLLVLDNFEHLMAGATTVADLLQGAPNLQIIVTSRTRLNLHGEQLYQVQPLTFAAVTTLAQAADADADAVRLFAQCAKRIHADFTVTATNLLAVLRICQLVEGMPLGLEMAAAWTEWLSLAEIANEIAASSDFLTNDRPDVPERQRSMRAVFAWSWKLLDEDEQRAFRLLSIFRGGFTREAALHVTGAPLRTLVNLVNKSLLYVTYTQESAAHYQIHELLRQFGAEQLDALPVERAVTKARHSEYYLTFLAARATALIRAEPRLAAAEIQQELDNVRQAWRYAIARANDTLLDQSVIALARFYELTGQLAESVQAIGRAVDKLEQRGVEPANASPLPPAHQGLRSKLIAILAGVVMRQGKFDEAIALAEQAVRVGKAHGGYEGETYGEMVMGQGFYRKGQYAEARARFGIALQLALAYQPDNAERGLLEDVEYASYTWLGAIETEMGNFAAAKVAFQQAIQICQLHNNARFVVHAQINLANLLRRTSDYLSAQQIYEACLLRAQTLGYHWGEGQTLAELGDTVRMLGDYGRAQHYYRQAEAKMAQSGYPIEELYCHISLALLSCYLGNYAQAHQWLDRIFQTPVLQESIWLNLAALLTRATFASQNDLPAQAIDNATAALALSQRLPNPQLQAHALLLLGHAQAALHLESATQSYTQASQIWQQLGSAAFEAEARAGLAQCALAQGKNVQAQALIEALLPRLLSGQPIGLDEPFFVYLTAYRILFAGQDERAIAILTSAYQQLQRYVAHIDDALRSPFLEKVTVHRELHHACMRAGLQSLLR